MLGALIAPGAEERPVHPPAAAPAAPTQNPRPKRLSRAAADAVAALFSEVPGADVLRDRGASDADLKAVVRGLARRGRTAEGSRLFVDRRTAAVEYGNRRRVRGRALLSAVRTHLEVPLPDAASPSFKPDVGRISDPVRLPTRRWGYRTDGAWWSSSTSADRDGENGFRRVRDPVTLGKLDAWARERFSHLYPAPAPATPPSEAPISPPPAEAPVQTDLLGALDDAPDETGSDVRSRNYRITGAEGIGEGSPRQKAAINLAAIRMLHALDAEERPPSAAEQAVLARYCGWGALPSVFDPHAAEWEHVRTELRSLMTPAELASAEASTPNSHFTSLQVIDGIYGVLAHLGFTGGKIGEFGAGVGHFIGRAPDPIARRSRWTAIESDRVTGRILSRLYPEEDVRIAGLEHTRIVEDGFDAIVGNVPFGRYRIHDPVHTPGGDLRVHDYFIVRAVAALRPGGLLVAITSRGSLDKASPEVRERIAAAADLLGAKIRAVSWR
jgi:hypothetical protein